MTDQLPPAGWYPDPENPSQQRWWDGQQWAEGSPPPAPGPPQPTWQGAGTGVPPAAPGQVTWQQASRPPTSGLAIAALVLAVVWICGLGSIAAVVCGILALRQIGRATHEIRGRGLAIAGIVVGGVGIVGGVLSVLLLVGAGDTIGDVFDCARDADATEAEVQECIDRIVEDATR